MSKWKSLLEEPPARGCKFVALYDDGSGARMFFKHDAGYIDSDGEESLDLSGTYDLWTELPEGFEFWCETRGTDTMTLSSGIRKSES
jgi:hypothetical protein